MTDVESLIQTLHQHFANKHYQTVLEIAANHAFEINYKLGSEIAFSACSLGHWELAVSYWKKVLAIQPESATTWYNLGLTYLQQQQNDSLVVDAFSKACQYKENWADAQFNLGCVLARQGLLEPAEIAYRDAIASNNQYVDAYNSLAVLLTKQNKLPAARAVLLDLLAFSPNHADGLYNLANIYKQQCSYSDAEQYYQQAIKNNPSHVNAYNNLGNLYRAQGRFTDAENAYRQSLQSCTAHHNAATYCNLALNLTDQQRYQDALDAYDAALLLSPERTETRLNKSLLLLLMGDFSTGLPLHESRIGQDSTNSVTVIPHVPFAQWHGQNLEGKTIVLWKEQGMGDEIQFIRYAQVLKNLGASRVLVVCSNALQCLFEVQSMLIDGVVSTNSTQAMPDYWVFMLSMPYYAATTLETIPAPLPYLQVKPDWLPVWQKRITTTAFKVGLVWKGSAGHANDAHRSLPSIQVLAPLWQVAGVSFISLQKGQAEDEGLNPPANQPLIHLGSDIAHFADTAAIISQLDLIICVDTAIAHLAGALGKPVWVLLPIIGLDWRWLLDREDSPWYPNVMRLFRQTQVGDWDEVISRVKLALSATVLQHSKA